MTTAIALHRVADYDAWRTVYDSLDEARSGAGVTDAEVLRSQDDPNLVIVRHDFTDRGSADAFFSSPELREGMAEAGVDLSSFQIHLTDPT
jgi:quinol monooxygenase YgiN